MNIEPDFLIHNKDVLDQLLAALTVESVAFIRFENTERGLFVSAVKASELAPKLPHCKTCQCNRVEAELPTHPADPKVKRTRSWHHG